MGKGWLSQNVIDCYLSVIVNKANLEEGSEKFGSLSCDDFALIQRDSVRNKFAFCTSVLDKNKKKITSKCVCSISPPTTFHVIVVLQEKQLHYPN